MDFETFVQSLAALVNSGENVYFVLYAAATCVLTQIFKKLLVNKVKVEVLHKFDFAVVLPFIFGAIFSAVDLAAVRHLPFSVDFVVKCILSAATVGALASVIFRFISSLSGKSLKSLLKDDLFGIFYTQLLYFGNVRSQLLDKKLSLKDFVDQVKLVSANALQIYKQDCSPEVKKDKLHRLLQGIISQESIATCVEVLNAALIATSASN